MTPVSQMTVEECISWVAESQGWNRPGTMPDISKLPPVLGALHQTIARGLWWKHNPENPDILDSVRELYPPTVDGAIQAWTELLPDSYLQIWIGNKQVQATVLNNNLSFKESHLEEKTVRWRLIVKCLEAKAISRKGHARPH